MNGFRWLIVYVCLMLCIVVQEQHDVVLNWKMIKTLAAAGYEEQQ